jgi:plasmid stability protein
MKNITLAIPDEVYRQARIRAAEQNTSISALVRGFLESLSQEAPSEFERLKALQEEVFHQLKGSGFDPTADRLSRDELHDRDALR